MCAAGASDSGNELSPAAGSLTSALCCLAIFEIRPMVQGTQAQVAIIGGGIGGLTAAASLLRDLCRRAPIRGAHQAGPVHGLGALNPST